VQGHQEHTKNHHDKIDHLEIRTKHDRWKNPRLDYDSVTGLGCQEKEGPSNLHEFDKKRLCH